MRIAAFMTLHYGADYLAYAVRSIIDEIDAIWFLYTPDGSFGGSPEFENPDSAELLFDLAYAASAEKFHWYTASPGQWRHEGEHCDFIRVCDPDADVYVRLDADEVWTPGLLTEAVQFARQRQLHKVRLPMIHYWRSFRKAVLNDPVIPDRVTHRHVEDRERIETLNDRGVIHHFGYAQRSELVRYKQALSSHRGEWRSGWFEEKFAANVQDDVHPVIVNHWFPVEIDPFAHGLPEFMKSHPFINLGIIP